MAELVGIDPEEQKAVVVEPKATNNEPAVPGVVPSVKRDWSGILDEENPTGFYRSLQGRRWEEAD